MDRFPLTVAGNGDVIVDTGIDRHRPADRHEHHRPGGRGPALHHRRRRALMTMPQCSRWRRRRSRGSSSSSSSSAGSSTPSSTRGSARKEVGSEIELAANRKPYYDDEVARGPAPRARPAARRAAARRHRHRPAAVLGARAEPPGRRDGGPREAASPAGAPSSSPPTADGGFNCAGCHGGMKATGGVAPYTVTDQVTGEVRAVELEGAGAEHRALPVRRGRGPLHPHLRPARSRRCRRGASTAAAR